ncbi:hypothetical protein [Sphingopyxis sp. PET50]|uniref:hypothetical protein n=1 Tax=Sphingopyxis sp. PET50 TaxID=2976533 RepID=UPI0021AE82F9|nr:hypothetical protein [Sphingopyxis sp. PET50]
MWTILWPLMLFGAVVVWPVWLWRRMKEVQRIARDALDDAPERDGSRWEEAAVGGDGLSYGKAHNFDPVLDKASRDLSAPDIFKDLEGRR